MALGLLQTSVCSALQTSSAMQMLVLQGQPPDWPLSSQPLLSSLPTHLPQTLLFQLTLPDPENG